MLIHPGITAPMHAAAKAIVTRKTNHCESVGLGERCDTTNIRAMTRVPPHATRISELEFTCPGSLGVFPFWEVGSGAVLGCS
jgi:hypothetical protein